MTIQIHGKDYVTVAERVAMVHESGKAFEIVASEPLQVGDRWLWRVILKIDEKQYIGTAEAKVSNARGGSPDASNPFECAETSALGRALGFAGFGAIESIASADEIVRGQSTIEAPMPSELRARAKELGKDFDAVVKFLFKKSIPDDELTPNDCKFIQVAFEKSAQIRKQTAASASGK